MPGSLTGSYRTLSGAGEVYRSTTVSGGGSGNAATGFIEGMKKAFSFMAGGSSSKDQKLIERVAGGGPIVISTSLERQKRKVTQLERHIQFLKDDKKLIEYIKKAFLNQKQNENIGRKVVELKDKCVQTWDGILCRACLDTEKLRVQLQEMKELYEDCVFVRRTENTNNKKMPASGMAEEAALLGTMPSDSMDDIELKNIQLQFPSARSLSRDDSSAQEEVVETDRGNLVIAVQGSRNKPAILTYHDLGLNYVSNFQAFFNYIDMRALLENFCVYHINAPGQEEGAATLPEDYIYPTMDELASQISYVLTHFGLKQFIGFGVGAGANILARFALLNPNQVTALCLINCVSTQAGWIEWGYQKLNARHLRSKGMTQGVLDYLMWHHFGRNTEERNHDLVQVYKSYFERNVNPTNLALFIDSYVRRNDLNIQRELDPTKRKESATLKMPVMNITGSLSPHVDDTVTFNGRLDPTNSSWMKISDCGMVLEEQPGKVSEAFRLFLQGEGYAVQVRRRASSHVSIEVAPLSPTKMALFRKTSLEELLKMKLPNGGQWPTNVIHITENPISAVVC